MISCQCSTGKLAGHDGRAAAVAILHDLEQIAALLGGHGSKSPIVEDQKLDASQALEQASVTAVAARERERIEQPRQALIEDRAVIPARLVAERAGNPTLADAGRADDEQVLVPVDPLAGDELVGTAPCRARAAPCMSTSSTTAFCRRLANRNRRDQPLVLALGRLAVDEESEPLLEGRARRCRAVVACSSSAFAMPVSPSATRRPWVGCVSIFSPFFSGSSRCRGCCRAGSAARPRGFSLA